MRITVYSSPWDPTQAKSLGPGDAGTGAAAGATAGAVRGRRQQTKANKAAEQQAQQQGLDTFRRAFSACMDSKGYSVK
jgi:hypothetical protein